MSIGWANREGGGCCRVTPPAHVCVLVVVVTHQVVYVWDGLGLEGLQVCAGSGTYKIQRFYYGKMLFLGFGQVSLNEGQKGACMGKTGFGRGT